MLMTVMFLFAVATVQAMKPDDVSSFFLKAPKSVPRAGRSAPGSYEGFFLKASKSVPRVGRRDGNGGYSAEDYQLISNNNYEKSQYQDQINDNEIPDYFDYDSKYLLNQYNEGKIPHRSRRYELLPHSLMKNDDYSEKQNINDNGKMNYDDY